MEIVATWTGELACTLRAAARETIEEFAARLGISARAVSKWEADPALVPALANQQVLDTALAAAPDDVQARFAVMRGGSVPQPPIPARTTPAPPAGDPVSQAAGDAEAELAILLSGPRSEAVAVLYDEATEVARAGNRTARDSFAAAARVRRKALALAGQARRPAALADLYVLAGQATALMASAAFDLNRWDESSALARSAVTYADFAGDQSLHAWTLGLAALLANWRDEPHTALASISQGLQAAPAGTPRVRLRSIAARSYAILGDHAAVSAMIGQARRDLDAAAGSPDRLSEETGGEFAFGLARAEACAAAAWLDLGDGAEAKQAATRALDGMAAVPRPLQSLSQRSGARIDLASACLLTGERDEAEEALGGVLGVPAAMRNVSLSGRLARTSSLLASPRWAADGTAAALSEAIGDWTAGRS